VANSVANRPSQSVLLAPGPLRRLPPPPPSSNSQGGGVCLIWMVVVLPRWSGGRRGGWPTLAGGPGEWANAKTAEPRSADASSWAADRLQARSGTTLLGQQLNSLAGGPPHLAHARVRAGSGSGPAAPSLASRTALRSGQLKQVVADAGNSETRLRLTTTAEAGLVDFQHGPCRTGGWSIALGRAVDPRRLAAQERSPTSVPENPG